MKRKTPSKKTNADPKVLNRPIVAIYPDGASTQTRMTGTKEEIRKAFISPGFACDVKFDDETVVLAPWLAREKGT